MSVTFAIFTTSISEIGSMSKPISLSGESVRTPYQINYSSLRSCHYVGVYRQTTFEDATLYRLAMRPMFCVSILLKIKNPLGEERGLRVNYLRLLRLIRKIIKAKGMPT